MLIFGSPLLYSLEKIRFADQLRSENTMGKRAAGGQIQINRGVTLVKDCNQISPLPGTQEVLLLMRKVIWSPLSDSGRIPIELC